MLRVIPSNTGLRKCVTDVMLYFIVYYVGLGTIVWLFNVECHPLKYKASNTGMRKGVLLPQQGRVKIEKMQLFEGENS